jgi:acyl-CoA thioester hydrolase
LGFGNTSVVIQRSTQIRVRYADTDQMKNVYYSKYFEYFEQGRSDFLRSLGLPYGDLERQGFLLPVIEAHAEYSRPAHYDDLLVIVTTLGELPAARVRLDYRIIRSGEKDSLVEGYTIHSFVKADNGKPTRAPGLFLDVLNKALTTSTV